MQILSEYPCGLAPQKPQQTITPEELRRILPHSLTTRKYNGNRCAVLVGPTGGVRIYSRNGTVEWTASLPQTCEALRRASFPANTFFDCELYVPQIENVEAVQRIVNAGNPIAGAAAEAKLRPALAVFDILFLNGNPVHTGEYALRRQIARTLLQDHTFIHPAEDITIRDYDHALDLVDNRGWEGLVVARLDAPNAINPRGNTKRGQLWKIKIRLTEDMIATEAQPSKDPALGAGTLKLYRKCNGSWIPAGKVGSFEVAFDRHAALLPGTLPIVVEVAHYGQDERGNLEFPKVCRRRADLETEMLASFPKNA